MVLPCRAAHGNGSWSVPGTKTHLARARGAVSGPSVLAPQGRFCPPQPRFPPDDNDTCNVGITGLLFPIREATLRGRRAPQCPDMALTVTAAPFDFVQYGRLIRFCAARTKNRASTIAYKRRSRLDLYSIPPVLTVSAVWRWPAPIGARRLYTSLFDHQLTHDGPGCLRSLASMPARQGQGFKLVEIIEAAAHSHSPAWQPPVVQLQACQNHDLYHLLYRGCPA